MIARQIHEHAGVGDRADVVVGSIGADGAPELPSLAHECAGRLPRTSGCRRNDPGT